MCFLDEFNASCPIRPEPEENGLFHSLHGILSPMILNTGSIIRSAVSTNGTNAGVFRPRPRSGKAAAQNRPQNEA